MNPRLSLISVACIGAITVLSTGCTSALVQSENASIEGTLSSADRMMENARTGAPVERTFKPMVNVHSTAWIPAKKMMPDEMKPGFEQGRREISINRDFRDIQDVAERITLLTGLPVSIASDVSDGGGAPSSASAASTGASSDPMASPSAPMPPMPPMMGGSPTSLSMNDLFNMPGLSGININYSGPLSGFLDVASSRFNISWRWNEDGRSIEFYRFETQTFRIAALPGDTTLNSSISPTNSTGATGGEGGGSSAGGGSEQTTSVSFSGLSVWSAMEESIRTMVGTSGKVLSSPALGTITVTDTPSVLKKVADFVSKQNASLGKQVVVNVKVLSVDVSNSKSYGINWDSVYKSLSKDYGFSFATSFVPSQSGASDLALNVISGGANGDMSARWGGSSAMVRALSSQGRVSQVTSAAVTTLNNQPVPVNVGRQIAYLASSTTTTTEGSGTSTSLQPGMINTGFSMNLVPHIQDGDQLLLQYAIDLSALKNIYTVESGDSSIQTPEIESRKFMQRVKLNSGDTLVVAGFEQANTDTDQSGIGSVANALLGGGMNGSRDRNALVILIQPVVVDY